MRDYYDALDDLLANATMSQTIEEVPIAEAEGRVLDEFDAVTFLKVNVRLLHAWLRSDTVP